MLTVSICLNFCCSTIFNQFSTPSKVYTESFPEKATESDEKSGEQFNSNFIQQIVFEGLSPISDDLNKYSIYIQVALPTDWPSPNTPPPDLA